MGVSWLCGGHLARLPGRTIETPDEALTLVHSTYPFSSAKTIVTVSDNDGPPLVVPATVWERAAR